MSRNIDFIAVLVIAVMMAIFSQLASLRVPNLQNPIELQNALVNADSCPTTREVLAHLGILN